MGFLDKLRGKKNEPEPARQTSDSTANQQNPPGRRIKKHTSDGKPVYE